jgi:Tol biopolymer transport system component
MQRLTVDTNGFGWTGDSGQASISADGRFVAVSTDALADPLDAGQQSDIYLIDRSDGSYRIVTLGADGTPSGGNSLNPVLSGDGSLVAFSASGNDLVTGQVTSNSHTYVTDVSTGANEILSVPGSTLIGTGQGMFYIDSFSEDGRFVGFASTGNNLLPEDTDTNFDVYVADRRTDTHILASVNSAGQKSDGFAIGGSVSDNGRYVAFYSNAGNLSALNNGTNMQVFLRDTVAGTTTQVSVNADGTAGGNGHSTDVLVSGDGNWLVYRSDATDLVAGDDKFRTDLFLWNRSTQETTRLAITDDPFLTKFDISRDGRYVVFDTVASLVAEDDNVDRENAHTFDWERDVYVYDRISESFQLVSQNDSGVVGNGRSFDPSISANGNEIVFTSRSTNLGPSPNEATNWADVFVASNPAFVGSSPPPITGTDGSEGLSGTTQAEMINALGGSDWINPGGGSDTIDGGAGNDMVSFANLGLLPGQTNVDYRLLIDLGAGIARSFDSAEILSLVNVERITGTIFGDWIRGDDGDNHLRGLGHYDWFVATTGNDTLDGGTGRDMVSYLEAAARASTAVQNVFSSVAPIGDVAGIIVDLNNLANNRGLAAGHEYVSIERITGSSHQDIFWGDGEENDFRGLGGYDWFVGSSGGRERYFGGAGIDTVTYFRSAEGVTASLRNGRMIDGEESGRGTAGDAARDLYFGIENLIGTRFGDSLTGNEGRNQLNGYWGDDMLFGYGGIDRLKGAAGNDTIDGGAGSDYAVFNGNMADTTLTRTGSTTATAVGTDGTDTLINVEYFVFDDGQVSIWEL